MIKIGYIILAHQQPSQLVRLMKRLGSNSNQIFLHIDKRINLKPFLDCEGFDTIKNLHLLKRFKSYWGAIGIVHATLEGIKLAIMHQCDYVILLSGTDYPIKDNTEIAQFLLANHGKNFLKHYQIPAPHWLPGKEEARLKKYYFYLNNKLFEFPIPVGVKSLPRKVLNLILNLFLPNERTFPKNIIPYGGDNWFCITHNACQEVTRFYQTHPEVLSFLKYSLCSDEIFIQTAFFNSGNADLIASVVNDTINEINWKNRNKPSPEIFNPSDFNRLLASDKMFARKFDHDQFPELIDRIDLELIKISKEKN